MAWGQAKKKANVMHFSSSLCATGWHTRAISFDAWIIRLIRSKFPSHHRVSLPIAWDPALLTVAVGGILGIATQQVNHHLLAKNLSRAGNLVHVAHKVDVPIPEHISECVVGLVMGDLPRAIHGLESREGFGCLLDPLEGVQDVDLDEMHFQLGG